MRFYVSPESIFPDKNLIEVKDRDEVHHIRDVMRLKKGIRVTVFDGRGKEYSGSIKQADRHSVVIDIEDRADLISRMPYDLALYQAIPKKNKMDFIVEKAVELGVGTIVPMRTERTVPVVTEKEERKISRWMRIANSASKQCGRRELPVVSDIRDFKDALLEPNRTDLVIFAALDKDAIPLKNVLKDLDNRNIVVFIGPEGDFSENEIKMAKEKGWTISSLGQSVLKVETAAIYILSCLNYETNEKPNFLYKNIRM